MVGPKDIEAQTLFNVAHEPALSDVLVIGNIYDNPGFLKEGGGDVQKSKS